MNKIKFLLLAILFCLPATVSAATITPGPLTITWDGSDQLFSELNFEPGQTVSKELTVMNNGRVAHNFAIATRNVNGELANKIIITAIEADERIWSNSLFELQELSTISKTITRLNPGQAKKIVLEAYFEDDSDASLSGKAVTFDLVYGTEELERSGTLTVFSTSPVSAGLSATPTPAPTSTASPLGEVRGEETNRDGLNPWYLVIAPAAVLASIILLPEFALAGIMIITTGGVAYVLGYSSQGTMSPILFMIFLIAEIVVLFSLAYFMLHHDNRASRKIKNHRHRLRLR